MPQPGAATAIFCSALRYAASAIDGMPSAPGEFTTIGGGGAGAVSTPTCKLLGGCGSATTKGPDEPSEVRTTAASGAMTALCIAGNRGVAPPTAPASISGVMTATPNAGVRVTRIIQCRAVVRGAPASERPPMRTGSSSIAWVRWRPWCRTPRCRPLFRCGLPVAHLQRAEHRCRGPVIDVSPRSRGQASRSCRSGSALVSPRPADVETSPSQNGRTIAASGSSARPRD